MELWEDGTGKFAGYWVSPLDIQNVFFLSNLKSKLRHAELL